MPLTVAAKQWFFYRGAPPPRPTWKTPPFIFVSFLGTSSVFTQKIEQKNNNDIIHRKWMHVTHKIPHNKRVTHKSIQDSKGYAKIAPNVSQSSVLGTPKIPLRVQMWPNMSPNELQCDPKWHRWPPQKVTWWCQMATSWPSGSQVPTKLKNLKNRDVGGVPFWTKVQ